MREIKFRAWDGDRMSGNFGMGSVRFYEHNAGGFYDGKNTTPMVWEKVVFMQYTGLKDKNDVEIYEGDILTGDYSDTVVIVYSEKDGAFGGEFKRANSSGIWNMAWCAEKEIIGNIYSNPELLEGAK